MNRRGRVLTAQELGGLLSKVEPDLPVYLFGLQDEGSFWKHARGGAYCLFVVGGGLLIATDKHCSADEFGKLVRCDSKNGRE